MAVSVIGAPPRSIWNFSVRPALALTIRCMSEKLSIGPAVDCEHHVAGLEAGGGGGGIGLHGIDPRGRRLPAIERENRGKDHDGQDEIGDRPGGDDGRAAPHRLVEEALAALGLGHAGDGGLVRHARGVVIPKKLHVAAERNRTTASSGFHSDR